jgi:AraC-like DNA-binding protein
MKPVIRLESIAEINSFVHCKTNHPLVAIVDFSKMDEYIEEGTRICADFYSVMFKNYCANKLRYGRQIYDFQEGSLICIAPRQVLTLDNEIEKRENMMGWGLFFHPDLLHGTPLGDKINTYTFFSYEVSEALHLSEKEKEVLYDCIRKIENELQDNIDNHSHTLIVSNIELFLNYCSRYYDRQFIMRKNNNSDILVQIEKLLSTYFKINKVSETGLPTVKYLAEQVCLSPNYLSDLLKKETGMNALKIY